jgi:hypothetical protein
MKAAIFLLASAIVTPPVDVMSVGAISPPGDGGSRSRDPFFIQAKVDILFEPNGRAVRCTFVPGSGNDAAAKAACRDYRVPGLTTKPSVNGVPSHALMRVSVFYFPISPPASVRQREPDASLSVNYLPGNADSTDVHVELAVDSTGKVTGCESGFATEQAAIITAVCSAPDMLDIKPATDKKGQPISYVTRRTVRLVLVKSDKPA